MLCESPREPLAPPAGPEPPTRPLAGCSWLPAAHRVCADLGLRARRPGLAPATPERSDLDGTHGSFPWTGSSSPGPRAWPPVSPRAPAPPNRGVLGDARRDAVVARTASAGSQVRPPACQLSSFEALAFVDILLPAPDAGTLLPLKAARFSGRQLSQAQPRNRRPRRFPATLRGWKPWFSRIRYCRVTVLPSPQP